MDWPKLIRLKTPENTWLLGTTLGRLASAGSGPLFIALSGELGAGKTTFTRAFCEGFGIRDVTQVTSPTFAIQHVYEGGSRPVHHFDFYRLSAVDELPDLGWDDLLREDAVVIAEWSDRFPEALPPGRIEIGLSHLEGAGETGRQAAVRLAGRAAEDPALREWIGGWNQNG